MVINMPDRSMPRVSADPTAAMNTKAGLLMKIINIMGNIRSIDIFRSMLIIGITIIRGNVTDNQ